MTQEANEGLVYLEGVRLSFPHLAAPHASAPGAEPKFSCDFIMEPGHPGYAAFHAMAQAKALEKFGEQTPAILQWIGQDKKLRSYGSGEEHVDKKTMQPYAGYPGMVFIKANNPAQPAMFGADGVQVMDARQFYGGCYVNAQVQPWIQDNTHGRAIRCELVGIQFHSAGEPFGAAPVDTTTLFGAVAGAPAAIAPGVAPGAQPGVQPPGGYNPALYPAPAAQPVAPAQPPAYLGVPGEAPVAPVAPTSPQQTPGGLQPPWGMPPGYVPPQQ